MSEIRVVQNKAYIAPSREETPIKRVAAYCRVSALREEQDDSYETQRAYYKRLIDADPKLTLVDVYGDHGVSGLSAKKRPEFQRMMKDCLDGKVDVVMTKSISRFARNLSDCVNCVRQLKERGIPVILEKEGFSSKDDGCDLMLSILAAMAQEESNNLSQHIRWSLDHRNASGNPPRSARYGYRKALDEKGETVWRIYEPEAERVRLAFNMAARGENYRMIIIALDNMEIKAGLDVRWTQARVYAVLKSEVYIGDILTNKSFTPDFLSKRAVVNKGQRAQYYLEDHHEPIIDRETFVKVGELISRNALRTRRTERGRKKLL